MTILRTHNLTIGYNSKEGRTEVLKGLNLSLNRGEVVCLIGANGKGKSTLLRTLAGTQPPLEGSVDIEGKPLSILSKKDLALMLSIVYTDRTSTGALTVEELTSLGRQPHTGFFGHLSKADRDVVEASMRATGILHKRLSLCAQLSDGERQKAMIAKALAQETPIIFLDEPTAFLDVASKIDTMQLLHDLAVEQNKAVLLSTHDISQALMLADSLWLIDAGQHLEAAPTEDLILSGKLDLLFNSQEIRFDIHSGSFSRQCVGEHSVDIVEGDASTAHWCANAMKRNGIAIDKKSTITIKPIAPNNIIIYINGKMKKTESVGELTHFILRYFKEYETK